MTTKRESGGPTSVRRTVRHPLGPTALSWQTHSGVTDTSWSLGGRHLTFTSPLGEPNRNIFTVEGRGVEGNSNQRGETMLIVEMLPLLSNSSKLGLCREDQHCIISKMSLIWHYTFGAKRLDHCSANCDIRREPARNDAELLGRRRQEHN